MKSSQITKYYIIPGIFCIIINTAINMYATIPLKDDLNQILYGY